MTTPGGHAPDGAYELGGGPYRYGQNHTEETIRALTRGETLDGYEESQDYWRQLESDVAENWQFIRDEQLNMNDRVDLLESVRGYANVFMSKNWEVASGVDVWLPFDTQLGPVVGAVPENNGITLSSKGLWRCDLLLTLAQGGNFPATASVVVETISGTWYTEHSFDLAITGYGPESVTLAHTFVIPTDGLYRVRVKLNQRRGSRHTVYGGTVRSGLSVNKWDNGTTNNVNIPDAPDGGALGG